MRPTNSNSALFREVKQFLAGCKCLKEGVVIGVSGGADSICLAHAVGCLLKKETCKKLVIAHLNHNARGTQSDADEVFVQDFCFKIQKECSVEVVFKRHKLDLGEISTGPSWEKKARVARYDWLSKVALEEKINTVFTAHTSNDQAETVLMRLIRGTGVQGLEGIKVRRKLSKGVMLARPILSCPKAQVISYLNENKISWCEDSSNLDTKYLRNKIRLQLIPLLRTEFQPAIDSILSNLAGHIHHYRSLEKRLAYKIGIIVEKPRVDQFVVLDREKLSGFSFWKIALFLRSLFAREGWTSDAINLKQWRNLSLKICAEGFEAHLAAGIRIRTNRFTVILGPHQS